jgi:hypothetical protein
LFQHFLPVGNCAIFFFFSFIVVLGRDTLWNLLRSLQSIKYIIWNSPPLLLSFTHPWFLEEFQQVSFLHLHTLTYFCNVLILLPLSLPPAPSHWCQLFPCWIGSEQDYSTLLFSDFEEEEWKKTKRKPLFYYYTNNLFQHCLPMGKSRVILERSNC